MNDSPQRTLRTQRLNEISGEIIDAAMNVHSTLGPGLLESVYETCLCHELNKRGLTRIIHEYCCALACSFARNKSLLRCP
jgi:hypothetical protein